MINQISKYEGEPGYVKNICNYQVFVNGSEVGAVSANVFSGEANVYVKDINGHPILNTAKDEGIIATICGEVKIKKR